MDFIQLLWIIPAVVAIAKSNDDRLPSKFPLNFRKFIDKQELCEFGYADYESCDNYVTMDLTKRYMLFGNHSLTEGIFNFVSNKFFLLLFII